MNTYNLNIAGQNLALCIYKRLRAFGKRLIGQPSADAPTGMARYKRDGAEKLRYQYDELDEDSVVFDVGGYEGDWASLIFSKYLSTVYVFEPVKSFCDHMADRFKKNGKVHIYDFGLSDRDETTDISLDANGSSTFGQNTSKESIRLRDVAAVIRELGVKDIDLMKINIEGGEYAVLERLIETGLIGRVINIQVQFHAFVPDAKVRMEHIQQELLKTHQPTFQYPWVWENWKRR